MRLRKFILKLLKKYDDSCVIFRTPQGSTYTPKRVYQDGAVHIIWVDLEAVVAPQPKT